MQQHERFTTVSDFRIRGGALDTPRLASVLVFGALHDTNLQVFLREHLYKGAQLSAEELRLLAKELFTGEGREKYTATLERDKCLGFSEKAVRTIVEHCGTPDGVLEVIRAMDFPHVRFVDKALFVDMEGRINFHGNMIPVVVFEALLPNTNLKRFLKKEMYFNHGVFEVNEIRDFARSLFLEKESTAYLAQLRRAGRLGYTVSELRRVFRLLKAPHTPAMEVATAMGYPRPQRRI